MSDSVNPPEREGFKKTRQPKQEPNDIGDIVLQSLLKMDREKAAASKPILISFVIALAIFSIITILGIIFYITTVSSLHNTYEKNLESIILSQASVKSIDEWENLPENQRKAKLREQFSAIVQYYTCTIPVTEKLSTSQIIDVYNELYVTTSKTSINFFFPVAYLKVATNFNPYYDKDSKKGIAAFYLKAIEDSTNLPRVREDVAFTTAYRGSTTAYNSPEMMRLLVARIENLMATFKNREDWVMLALFTNEYDVIQKYWKDGTGTIPDEFYKSGQVAEALKYYYAFKAFKIPIVN